MQENIKLYLDNLSFRTSLLESLEWDEEILDSFLTYLEEKFQSEWDPIILLEDIKDLFGYKTFEIMAELFKKEYGVIFNYDDKGVH
jgi:hypothetical protein